MLCLRTVRSLKENLLRKIVIIENLVCKLALLIKYTYQAKPICSVSSIVCGNVLFNVSGNIRTNIAATSDRIPYKTVGRLIHTRV